MLDQRLFEPLDLFMKMCAFDLLTIQIIPTRVSFLKKIRNQKKTLNEMLQLPAGQRQFFFGSVSGVQQHANT